MKGYKHLTWHDRLKIDKLHRDGMNQSQIAAILHVSRSTISRELKRSTYTHLNTDLTTVELYNPEGAQERYRANMEAKGAPLKIGKDHALAQFLENKIADDKYSPAAALAEIERLGLHFTVTISRQTLYNYIDKSVFLRITNKDLPFGGRRRKHQPHKVRASRPPKGTSIEKRPEEINDRREFGHWEMDCLESSRAGHSAILVLTERQARQNINIKMADQTAASVVAALDTLEVKYGKLFPLIFLSITVDNGSEFADCTGLERSIYGGKRTKLYYCHPRNPQERGSNEKQNVMIRRHYPKGTNFDNVSDEELAGVTDWLNNYPRKMFNWNCSQNLFNAAVSSLFTTS